MTAFPSAEDYIRAIQRPQAAFRFNPRLQGARFAVHPVWQIPVPASGNAAVVFRATIEGRQQALRFFVREEASTRDRYRALAAHVDMHGLTGCVTSADWQDDVVEVNGRMWPVVEMPWIDGCTLDAYVEQLVRFRDLEALAALASTWRGLVAQLQNEEFAHGDLQHGNVLLDVHGYVRLVDLDGSWISAFTGMSPPKEAGHPNYQRAGREWGRWMDTFPGLVVYIALLTLSKTLEPWSTLNGGENLLFRAEDFQPPFVTATWQTLAAVRDPELDRLTEHLRRCCVTDGSLGQSLEALLVTRRDHVLARGPEPPWWVKVQAPQSATTQRVPIAAGPSSARSAASEPSLHVPADGRAHAAERQPRLWPAATLAILVGALIGFGTQALAPGLAHAGALVGGMFALTVFALLAGRRAGSQAPANRRRRPP